MKKILSLAFLFTLLPAFAASWTNYPYITAPYSTDTFLLNTFSLQGNPGVMGGEQINATNLARYAVRLGGALTNGATGLTLSGTFNGSTNGFTNIVFFSTNSTQVQVQNACSNSNIRMVFYPGNYYGITNLFITGTNVNIDGYGANFYFPAAGSNWMFYVATNAQNVNVAGLHCLGGETSKNWWGNPKGIPWPPSGTQVYFTTYIAGNNWISNRHGMFIPASTGGSVQDVEIEGFSGYGMFIPNIYNANSFAYTQTGFRNIHTHDNFVGFWPCSSAYDYAGVLSPTYVWQAHYFKVSGLESFNNSIGCDSGAANINFINSTITGNWLGVKMGNGDGIVGHGEMTGLTINHNTHAIYAYALGSGMLIHNNLFFGGGDLYFDGCVEVSLAYNGFDNTSTPQPMITFTNQNSSVTGYNFIHDNWYRGTNLTFNLTSTVSTNYEWGNYSVDYPATHSATGLFPVGIFGNFTGNGAGVTNLNAGNLTGGPITNVINLSTTVLNGDSITVGQNRNIRFASTGSIQSDGNSFYFTETSGSSSEFYFTGSGSHTLLVLGQSLNTSYNPLTVLSTITANNGFVAPYLAAIPTNSITASNVWYGNYLGNPVTLRTNVASGGFQQWSNYVWTAWP